MNKRRTAAEAAVINAGVRPHHISRRSDVSGDSSRRRGGRREGGGRSCWKDGRIATKWSAHPHCRANIRQCLLLVSVVIDQLSHMSLQTALISGTRSDSDRPTVTQTLLIVISLLYKCNDVIVVIVVPATRTFPLSSKRKLIVLVTRLVDG